VESSRARLQAFFEHSPAAKKAVRPLAKTARVALELDEGPIGFTMRDGAPCLVPGPLADPDFTLRLPAGAVEHLAAIEGEDVGAVGIAFFELVLDREPARHVGLAVQGSTVRLMRHGYLAVLALGGARVALWLLKRGFADPRRVIDRLRGR
jgi:hypothetical protein